MSFQRIRWQWLLVCLLPLLVSIADGATPTKQAVSEEAAQRAVKTIPKTISGKYEQGELIELNVRDRMAYVLKPTGPVDPQRRWVWICPFWLGINNGFGVVEHRFYVEQMLAKGLHVAGINVGTSCGSPKAAEVCHEFYQLLIDKHQLNSRCRIVGQSNGGLIAYAWAFRHPECVERIAGICPATDFRTWPGLYHVTVYPDKGLDYGLTLDELTARMPEFNPVDNLAPLAKAKVKILHLHGDQDELVPMKDNSTVLAEKYQALGGSAEIVVLQGLGHGGIELYESEPFIEFLTAE